MKTNLERIIRYMVRKSSGGIFIGTPRPKMERIGVSCGPLYNNLDVIGIKRYGKGKKAYWHIPKKILREYQPNIFYRFFKLLLLTN